MKRLLTALMLMLCLAPAAIRAEAGQATPLPAEPLIVEEAPPADMTPGGTLLRRAQDARQAAGQLLCEGLFRVGEDGSPLPNVAQGYEVNADATVYTIRLRQGMCWSDGHPFTADDCVWFYNAVCLNRLDSKGVRPAYRDENGTPAALEALSETAYTVTFASPRPRFIEALAADPRGHYAPRHALGEIVQAILDGDNSGALALAQERFGVSFTDVAKLGKETLYYPWSCPGVPTLNAFVLSPDAGSRAILGAPCAYLRNPFYWKVDRLGRPLPYEDQLVFLPLEADPQP